MRVAYITRLFDPGMSYRENILCDYLSGEVNLDVYFCSGNVDGMEFTAFNCPSLELFNYELFFSFAFLFKKYDYIIVSDLRQISPIFFILAKLFTSSRIIIEHEQRSFGTSLLGCILSILLWLPMAICFMRSDLIRSPNRISSRFLSFFPGAMKKTVERPLAICKSGQHFQNLAEFYEQGSVLWSGKRFAEKSGKLLLEALCAMPDKKFIFVSDECAPELSNEVSHFSMLTKAEFSKVALRCCCAVYLSPTQSIYDVASLGVPVITASIFIPDCVPDCCIYRVGFSVDRQGNVVEDSNNLAMLKAALFRANSLSRKKFEYGAADLWNEYTK